MARTAANIPAGVRIADHISLGVLTTQFPRDMVEQVLFETERVSERERDLPAHVMVYFAIALALYADVATREVLRCLVEGARWLGDPVRPRIPTKSAISQARSRLGAAPLEALYRAVVAPVAVAGTPGAWYRDWRVMSLDGTTLDVSDTPANAEAFGRPGSGRGVNATGAFPKLRLVALVENGTHALCGAHLADYHSHEVKVAAAGVVPALTGEMLCLADRGFLGFDLFQQASATGAALVWRAKVSQGLPVLGQYDDGSYRSELRWNSHCQSADRTPIPVRVVVYTLRGSTDATVVYRLVTNILDPARAPAAELAQLYHERWEIETAFDEFKTHLRGGQRVLRSKTPELVEQEAWGFLLAHFALRTLMHDAALGALPRARDPDTLSFVHVVRVTRRTLSHLAAISPSGLPALAGGTPARAARGDGELQPRSPRAAGRQAQDE